MSCPETGQTKSWGGYDYFKLLKLMDFIGRNESVGRANLLRRIFPGITSQQQAWMQYAALKGYPAAHPALPYRFQAFQFKNQLMSDGFVNRLPAHDRSKGRRTAHRSGRQTPHGPGPLP